MAVIPTTSPSHPYFNDGDAEKKNDHDNDNSNANHEDGDADASEEYEETFDNGDYHDSDDNATLHVGRAANAAEKQAITTAVKHYYILAAAQNGMQACSMMVPTLAGSVAETYGGNSGPVYLRGGKTCSAVMTLLFKHSHAQLVAPVHVTSVRVEGDAAHAFLGSKTMPAGYIIMKREGSSWRVNALLGGALP